jgi:hypothetical protein
MSADSVEAAPTVDPTIRFRGLLDSDDPVCAEAYAKIIAGYPGIMADPGAPVSEDSGAMVSAPSAGQQSLERQVNLCLNALSRMPYDADTSNCQHFVQWVKTCLQDRYANLQATSPSNASDPRSRWPNNALHQNLAGSSGPTSPSRGLATKAVSP